MMRVGAVLTSHNRAALTVECLRRLEIAGRHAGVEVAAFLVDDGSSDGTAAVVAERFPWVSVDRADGSLFWNRGMHRAMALALAAPRAPDHLLWLNDDTELAADALVRLLDTAAREAGRAGRPVIVVGATADRSTGRLSYGGLVASGRWRPLTFRKLADEHRSVACETMNGNVVLLPMAVVRDVGNLDPAFEHSMGDIDYGLRAHRRGHPIVVAPGFVGVCSTNPVAGTHHDASLPLRVRWRRLVNRKAVPPRSWLRLTRRHGGWLWPLYFAWPYVRLLCTGWRVHAAVPPTGTRDA